MRITQLLSTNPTAAKFIDESATCQTVINDATDCFTVVVGKSELTQPTHWAS
jgi:hypothetical protein